MPIDPDPTDLLPAADQPPRVVSGQVLEVLEDGRCLVTVPELDGGRDQKRSFGALPDVAAGDQVRLLYDAGELILVAREPA